jgi:hypothetical protein
MLEIISSSLAVEQNKRIFPPGKVFKANLIFAGKNPPAFIAPRQCQRQISFITMTGFVVLLMFKTFFTTGGTIKLKSLSQALFFQASVIFAESVELICVGSRP